MCVACIEVYQPWSPGMMVMVWSQSVAVLGILYYSLSRIQ